MKVIVLSYEVRLRQLERLEQWCRKATTWQQYRVALPIGLFLGTAAGLIAGLAPYPTPDEVCQIMTDQMKVQFGAFLLPEDFQLVWLQNQTKQRDHLTSSIGRVPTVESVQGVARQNLSCGFSPNRDLYRVLPPQL